MPGILVFMWGWNRLLLVNFPSIHRHPLFQPSAGGYSGLWNHFPLYSNGQLRKYPHECGTRQRSFLILLWCSWITIILVKPSSQCNGRIAVCVVTNRQALLCPGIFAQAPSSHWCWNARITPSVSSFPKSYLVALHPPYQVSRAVGRTTGWWDGASPGYIFSAIIMLSLWNSPQGVCISMVGRCWCFCHVQLYDCITTTKMSMHFHGWNSQREYIRDFTCLTDMIGESLKLYLKTGCQTTQHHCLWLRIRTGNFMLIEISCQDLAGILRGFGRHKMPGHTELMVFPQTVPPRWYGWNIWVEQSLEVLQAGFLSIPRG